MILGLQSECMYEWGVFSARSGVKSFLTEANFAFVCCLVWKWIFFKKKQKKTLLVNRHFYPYLVWLLFLNFNNWCVVSVLLLVVGEVLLDRGKLCFCPIQGIWITPFIPLQKNKTLSYYISPLIFFTYISIYFCP